MKFRIGKKTYSAQSVDRLSLRQWIRIEQETTELGIPMKYGEIRRLVDRISSMGNEAEYDDHFMFFVGVVVWASRYDAGEKEITFSDAVDFPLGDLEIFPEAGDLVKPGGGVGGPRRARPSSGRAGAAAASSSAAKTKSRSARPSSDD